MQQGRTRAARTLRHRRALATLATCYLLLWLWGPPRLKSTLRTSKPVSFLARRGPQLMPITATDTVDMQVQPSARSRNEPYTAPVRGENADASWDEQWDRLPALDWDSHTQQDRAVRMQWARGSQALHVQHWRTGRSASVELGYDEDGPYATPTPGHKPNSVRTAARRASKPNHPNPASYASSLQRVGGTAPTPPSAALIMSKAFSYPAFTLPAPCFPSAADAAWFAGLPWVAARRAANAAWSAEAPVCGRLVRVGPNDPSPGARERGGVPERFAFWEPRYTSGAIDVVAGGRLLPGDALYSSCGWDSGAVDTLAYVARWKGPANRASGACWV